LFARNPKSRDISLRACETAEQYIDSLGVFGDAIIGILAAVAQQERIRISERTKAGMERVRKQGKRIGRPESKTPSRTTLWRRSKRVA
jgi:DNA invertase Pin-like site-specific DNA recombinase